MEFAIYLINLERAVHRLRRMDQQLRSLGLEYIRVSAVNGKDLAPPYEDFDPMGYIVRTGKRPNPAEIGCHLSHLRALEAFLASDAKHALILEDDAHLPDDLAPLLEDALRHSASWDLLRLSSTREGRYIELARLLNGRRLVVDTRVLKNTASYLINRRAAQLCLERLRPMRWPYDVALDRDWHLGFRTVCIHPFPIRLTGMPGQIPKAPRVRLFRSTTFHLLHLADHIRRILYRRKAARQALTQAST